MKGEVRIARGARAAEAVVLETLRAHAAAVRAEPDQPGRLARPLHVVVPSRSLRNHLAEAAVRSAGALAGVSIQTLHGLAHSILERCGESLPEGEALVPVLSRRVARREPALREALDGLEDGYAAVAGCVSDLLDAGLERASAEAIDELLGEEVRGASGARARAVVRTAAGVAQELAALGLEPRSGLFRRAREQLAEDPARALPGEVLVHGYADATGVQADLIHDLLVFSGARVVLDRPPDPAHPEREDLGARFVERLETRLALGAPVAGEPLLDAPAPEPPAPELLCVAGVHGGARAVAERIHGLLASGVAPERIGVVARQLEPHATALRLHLKRRGVPFAGAPGATGPVGPGGRRIRALLDLLARREQAATDRWLDARNDLTAAVRSELRLGFHTLGAARLVDLAGFDVAARPGEEAGLRLPVPEGLEDDPGERPRRRRLGRQRLEAAVAAAGELEAHLRGWLSARDLAAHRRALDRLVGLLGWGEDAPGRAELVEAAERLGRALPAALPLDFEEFRLLAERALEGRGRVELGGAGAGVAILSVTDARARCFEHLFVLGLERDGFPRIVAEDPLLPDALRSRIETLLPDVPIKRRGHDEERHLFAQLVSSSPRVTLVFQSVDDDGRERSPSPFVERIRLARGGGPVPHAPSPLDPDADGPFDAFEEALRAGLAGGERRLAALLPAALGEGRERLGLPGAEDVLGGVGEARRRVLREFERAPGGDLGPWFGFLGRRSAAAEPLWVTRLEALAWCAWQGFLSRSLGLEAVPDARAELPQLTPLRLGLVVHGVLETIALDAGVPRKVPLESLVAARPHRVPWPDAAAVERRLERAAADVVREHGIGLRGFARLLASASRPLLERIRDLDWGREGVRADVVGVEIEGRAPFALDGEARELFFRADRVDAGDPASRELRLTDYKVGRLDSTARAPDARAEALRREIAQGRKLQAFAYAASGGAGREGRYVFARSKLGDEGEALGLRADDAEAAEAFANATATLQRAWEAGSLTPRLLAKGLREAPNACERCEVREACLQGDSGALRRLRGWLEEAPGRGESGAEQALRALAALPEAGS